MKEYNIKYLTQVHNDTFMNFLPQMSTENLNQGDLQSWDFTMHEYASQVKLNLETNVNLEKTIKHLRTKVSHFKVL